MGNVINLTDYNKGDYGMTCKECGQDGEPVEKNKTTILCAACNKPYNYFQTSEYLNKKKIERLKNDRAEANKNLKRSLRL
jgi:hypothetical protein